AVGLELVETESREPVRGIEGAEIWAEIFPALAGKDTYAVDFFSHLDRVREFCKTRKIQWREAAGRCVVISSPSGEGLRQLLERFAAETFGLRGGPAAQAAAATLEADLSQRGLHASQQAYTRYTSCALCEPPDGW